jgi:hypothetical protein
MLVHYCKSNVKFELSFQFVCMSSHESLTVALSSSPYVIHSGIQLAPKLFVVALHQAFLLSQVLPFIIHS